MTAKQLIEIGYAQKLRDRLEAKSIPEPNSGCRLWLGCCDKDGYGIMGAFGQTGAKAHRVSYKVNVGDPGELHVLHRCDVTCCIEPTHLFLGTNQDNVDDKIKKGRGRTRVLIGDQNPNRKLNWGNVRDIRASQQSTAKLGALYSVSRETIRRIKLGVDWPE